MGTPPISFLFLFEEYSSLSPIAEIHVEAVSRHVICPMMLTTITFLARVSKQA
jgi:hypothetical protein